MAPPKLAPRQQTLLHIVSVHLSAEMSNNNELLEKPKNLYESHISVLDPQCREVPMDWENVLIITQVSQALWEIQTV